MDQKKNSSKNTVDILLKLRIKNIKGKKLRFLLEFKKNSFINQVQEYIIIFLKEFNSKS